MIVSPSVVLRLSWLCVWPKCSYFRVRNLNLCRVGCRAHIQLCFCSFFNVPGPVPAFCLPGCAPGELFVSTPRGKDVVCSCATGVRIVEPGGISDIPNSRSLCSFS